MLDLKTEAIAKWLAVHGSEDLARSPPRADDGPELSDVLAAFSSALDGSVQDGVEPLEAALHQGLSPSMAEVIAHLGPARRLRLLHWLTEAGFDQPARVIDGITDPGTQGGAVVLRWMTALLRREQLDRLFSADRIETLKTACRNAGLKETNP